MRAMILAGGMSTRLYPLTKQVPKPIVPVAGEPISGHVLRWLSSFGYDEVAINVFYLADLVEATFGDWAKDDFVVHQCFLKYRDAIDPANARHRLQFYADRFAGRDFDEIDHAATAIGADHQLARIAHRF